MTLPPQGGRCISFHKAFIDRASMSNIFGVTLKKTGVVRVEPPTDAATPAATASAPRQLVRQNSALAAKISAKLDKHGSASTKERADSTAPPPPPPNPPASDAAEPTAQSPPRRLSRRPSDARALADVAIKPAWERFLAASEVLETVAAYRVLRGACAVPTGAYGRIAFDAVLQATLVSDVPHKTKSLVQALAENWKLRPMAHSETPRAWDSATLHLCVT